MTTRLGRWSPALLLTLATALVAALLVSTAGPGQAAARTGGADYGAPEVGECHDLALSQVSDATDPTPAIACNRHHTAQITEVAHLPRRMHWSDPVERLWHAAIHQCWPALRDAVNGHYRVLDRSTYVYQWFEPTKAERRHGARWFACYALMSSDGKLKDLPVETMPFHPSGDLPDKVARCLTAHDYARVNCTHRHAYRATGTFAMSQKTYPGHDRIARATDRHCPGLTAPYRWRAEWHAKPYWERAGDRTVTCYAKNRL